MQKKISKNKITQIINLHNICFEKKWTENFVLKLIENSTGLIFFEKEKQIIAMILYQKTDITEIITICVHPDFRKQGIAKNLLLELKTKMKKRKIMLEVNERNIPAIKLYKKLGFKEINVRKNYYKEKEKTYNALIMEL